jgi:hypothetical protein
VGLFRREPLHRRLAREAGLLGPDEETLRPSWDKVGVHGISRPRAWDTVVTTDASGIDGTSVDFVALEDGTLVVEEQEGDADLSPLADAVETKVALPYRAHGVRQGDALWAVAARKIELARFRAEGDALELTVHEGERTLIVDGERTFGSIPELETIGERHGRSFAVRALRVDGDVWEVEATPL